MNLPNALTLLRLALVPVFAWLYANGDMRMALIVYLVAALTDALDGYLARKLDQITWFGKLCDPAADKLMQLTMLTCLATTKHVPWWVLIVLLIKELYLAVGSLILLKRKIVIQANILGKAATLAGVAAILCLFPCHQIKALATVGHALLLVALILSVGSIIPYTLSALAAVRENSKPT